MPADICKILKTIRTVAGRSALLAALALAYLACADGGGEVSVSGAGSAGGALAALAAGALRARGVPAAAAPPPADCAPPAPPDGAACRRALLAALVAGRLHAALLPLPATASSDSFILREFGVEDVGDAAPLARRACFATRPPARSLLDLADSSIAGLYRLADDELDGLASDSTPQPSSDSSTDTPPGTNSTISPEWCSEVSCATLLVGEASEAGVLAAVVREHRLMARVVAVGSRLEAAAAALRGRPAVLCSRAPAAAGAALPGLPLGPPSCQSVADSCPFEPRRFVKLVNVQVLASLSPRALHVLARVALDTSQLIELQRRARQVGPRTAASEFLAARAAWPSGSGGEVRVGVLVPLSGPREAFDGLALAAAAELAEEDSAGAAPGLSFKVELYDDACTATRAFKYLTDSRGSEYHALAGVAGPACAAAFADVARQSTPLRLPVLAYSAQAAPAGGGALLAAGAAGDAAAAWGALLAAHRWRRVAVLSERAAAFDLPLLRADVVVHLELHDEDPETVDERISQWAERVAAARARVVLVAAEDARLVRAALCAGAAAGLLPAAGAVWLLPAALPARWLRPAAARCPPARLRAAAEGHLSLAPRWLAEWQRSATPAAARDAWEARWRSRCTRDLPHPIESGEERRRCGRAAPAHAALLYDVLRLWAGAALRLLAASPAAIDDLHSREFVQALVLNATAVPYTGLTGEFKWTKEPGGAHVRASPLVLQQWRNGSQHSVGRWADGALTVSDGALLWLTADGAAPDDGGEHCALQPLADLLGADCRAAVVALAALLLALLVAALTGVALACRRRAEREYRARLAALEMRTLPKPGLDRWELPRERVVINRKLGTGAFGTVYGGHALLAEERGWSAVAVKTLKAGASTEAKLDFLSEAEAMKRFEHKNVVKLLGVVTKTEPVCTVMEFMLYGDLKNYLLARRHLADDEGADEVSAARLTSMALDVARALSYLAQQRYVHRDVAARNCLVSAHRVVKLADFGMTRLVFENDYYRFSRKGMLPVRWMAPESLALGVFSPASDVWSFGVLLYEIVTFGALPFQGLSNAEVLARVKAGHTLDLPPGLKPQLEGLIRACWRAERRARPAAAGVAALLADWPRLLAPCLDVPLDVLPLDADAGEPWPLPPDRAQGRGSWGAPSARTDATDTTYLSAPLDTDAFLP